MRRLKLIREAIRKPQAGILDMLEDHRWHLTLAILDDRQIREQATRIKRGRDNNCPLHAISIAKSNAPCPGCDGDNAYPPLTVTRYVRRRLLLATGGSSDGAGGARRGPCRWLGARSPRRTRNATRRDLRAAGQTNGW